MLEKPLFPEPINFRRQFGDNDKPLWGKSFDQFSTIDRKEYDKQVRDTMLLLSDGNKELNFMANSLAKRITTRGLGRVAALEVMFRIGVLLNEISEAQNGGRI
jgi:hypothetical protein